MIRPEDITIIIPHLGGTNESEYAIEECIKSLNETAPDVKKIVVTNGLQCMNHGNIILQEQGQCKAVNAAVATTNTPWIFITNDDMVYAPGWFEKLNSIDTMANRTVSPVLVEPRPGAPTFEVFFAGGAGGDFDKQKYLDYVEKRTKEIEHDLSTYGGKRARSGFNLPFLMSRELWDTVGGYDINYDPWGSNSDSDLEYKIKLAGGYMVQITDFFVYHFSQTSGTFHPDNDSYRYKNYAYFKEKWNFERTDDGIWTADFHIPTKEEGRMFLPDWEAKYGKVY